MSKSSFVSDTNEKKVVSCSRCKKRVPVGEIRDNGFCVECSKSLAYGEIGYSKDSKSDDLQVIGSSGSGIHP